MELEKVGSPVKQPTASIVIRAKNEEALLGETLRRLQCQTFRDFEIVLVDSGSTDRTLEIGQRFQSVRIIQIRPEEFTFGRALNIGCTHSRGAKLVFLSAHALPGSSEWLSRLLSHFADERVVGVWGAQRRHPKDARPHRIVHQSLSSYLADVYFGFNNSNGAVRRDIWESFPFKEEMPGSEDKEWALRVLSEGHLLVHDSEAFVIHRHDDSMRQAWWRAHRELLGYKYFLPDLSIGFAETIRYAFYATLGAWETKPAPGRMRRFFSRIPRILATATGRYTGSHQKPRP